MITSTTGCMLVCQATGEKLPVTGLVFDQGGAVSTIYTLEDGIDHYNDAEILEDGHSIELIRCGRVSDTTLDLIAEHLEDDIYDDLDDDIYDDLGEVDQNKETTGDE